MSSITVASRAHRILKKLDRFEYGSLVKMDASYDLLARDKVILGVYRGDSWNQDIVFTEDDVIFTELDGRQPRAIRYSIIQAVEYPLPASDAIDLKLHLIDASIVLIRIVGRQGNYRDVFEMGRFFSRVAEDGGRGSLTGL